MVPHFSGHFRRSDIGIGNGSVNVAFLAANRGQKGAPPDWRRVGRDFPTTFRKSKADHCELTMPDFRTLIAAKDASFLAILGDPILAWG